MKLLARYNKDCRMGQALLELAIFGSFLIMLMGVLINYGLRYYYEQRINQDVFRRALKSAADSVANGTPTSVTHLIIKDKHIPDPSDPWAVGSVMPFMASAAVTRNPKLHETADNESELPRLSIDFSGTGNGFFNLTTAGFTEESRVLEKDLDKYKYIYSDNIVACVEGGLIDGRCNGWVNLADKHLQKTCERWDEITIEGVLPRCLEYSIDRIRIQDANSGQIVDHGSAVNACRQIIDPVACKAECDAAKAPGSTMNCRNVCSKDMNVPWYCQNARLVDLVTRRYVFPEIDNLFALAGPERNMGLQGDWRAQNTRNDSLAKQETNAGITDTEHVEWTDTKRRWLIFRADPAGNPRHVSRVEVIKRVTQDKDNNSWQTDW